MTTVVKIDAMPSVAKPVEGVDYNVVQGTPQNGDPVRVTSQAGVQFQGCYTPMASPPAPLPETLSATAFNKHCWAALGGMGRFQELLEACRDHLSDKALRAIYTHYCSSTTFHKDEVTVFVSQMVAGLVMTQDEANAILNNWPAS